MGEEKQFGLANGKPDPEISSGKVHGWSKSDFTSSGNLVRINTKSLLSANWPNDL